MAGKGLGCLSEAMGALRLGAGTVCGIDSHQDEEDRRDGEEPKCNTDSIDRLP
jgi:hypothetical protein